MLPILPREMLWTDKQTMDEFFELDPINHVFFEGFNHISTDIDALKVFNEVYYQLTRMAYERPVPNQLPQYVCDVRRDIGSDDGVVIVMTMCYFHILLFNASRRPFNMYFVGEIKNAYDDYTTWVEFRKCYHRLRKKYSHVNYFFEPKPVPADELRNLFVNWLIITRNFELSSIEHVLRLWPEGEERQKVALMIEDSIGGAATRKKVNSDLVMLRQYFRKYHEGADEQSLSLEDRLRIALRKQLSVYESKDSPLPKMISIEEAEKMVEENLIGIVESAISLGLEETKNLDYVLRKKYWGTDKYPQLFKVLDDYVQHPEKKSEIMKALLEMVELIRNVDGVSININNEFSGEIKDGIFPNAQVTMQEPQFRSMYEISGNNTVNLDRNGNEQKE